MAGDDIRADKITAYIAEQTHKYAKPQEIFKDGKTVKVHHPLTHEQQQNMTKLAIAVANDHDFQDREAQRNEAAADYKLLEKQVLAKHPDAPHLALNDKRPNTLPVFAAEKPYRVEITHDEKQRLNTIAQAEGMAKQQEFEIIRQKAPAFGVTGQQANTHMVIVLSALEHSDPHAHEVFPAEIILCSFFVSSIV